MPKEESVNEAAKENETEIALTVCKVPSEEEEDLTCQICVDCNKQEYSDHVHCTEESHENVKLKCREYVKFYDSDDKDEEEIEIEEEEEDWDDEIIPELEARLKSRQDARLKSEPVQETVNVTWQYFVTIVILLVTIQYANSCVKTSLVNLMS